MVRQIPLTRGLVALVDDADFDDLNAFRWHALTGNAAGKFYAARGIGDGRVELMHRRITGFPEGMVVDHLDGDPLNNVRSNLRVCTRWENAANRQKTHGSSRFKGVSWHKRGQAWQAAVRVHRKGHYVGWFKDEEDAARAYDAAARLLLGANAPLNFPLPGERSALLRRSNVSGTETQSEAERQEA